MQLIDINSFIKRRIVQREQSLFERDIEAHKNELQAAIENKSVLVIGGAGTIGSSFVKAVLKFEPGKLTVIDTNENGLTELTRDLRSTANQFVPEDYKTYPMNFGDPVFKKMFLREGRFNIVANFAAHKHVRSEKDEFSVEAMLENNVFKAAELLKLLSDHPPEKFFCVSTDKAANPVNVMGASKKLMEEVIMAYSTRLPITTARFANVAFSNGSLLDGYVQRLMKRQPLSCPADVKRYFVSPEESGQICMLACMLGKSGEIFFPKLDESELTSFKEITEEFFSDMGKSIHVCSSEEEARRYMLKHDNDAPYPVYFFASDTSGEKQYEEFYTKADAVDTTRFHGLGVIENAAQPKMEVVDNTIRGLQSLLQQEDYSKADIVTELATLIPDFAHIETGKNLDQKM